MHFWGARGFIKFAKHQRVKGNPISRNWKTEFGDINLESGEIAKPERPEPVDPSASSEETAASDESATDSTLADLPDTESLEALPEETPEETPEEISPDETPETSDELPAPEEPARAAVPLAEREPVAIDPDKPFHILIAGDFSGKVDREDGDRTFKPVAVDRDNFEEVFEDLEVSLDLQGIPLAFRELEDFHPDRLFEAVPLFGKLDRVSDAPAPAPRAVPKAAPKSTPVSGLLNQIVAEHGEEPAPPVSADDANDLAAFIRRVTAGHLAPRPDAAAQKRSERRHELAAELMRAILHDARFQALEAAWRGLFMLIRGLDTDGNVKVYILDVTLPELIQNRASIEATLADSGPWALIAGNYSFGQSALDAKVLGRLATLAKKLNAPFVSEAQPPKKEVPNPDWRALRQSPEARWVGLALPRFLLRLPYGKQTSAVESFPFEEMPPNEHAAYLWGNPAFFCAYLLGQSFLLHEGDMRKLERRIGNLPLHVYQEDGESVAKPCAEVLMTERDAEALMAAGFMPLASLKHQDAAMIVRFQSIASPPKGLGAFG